MWEIILLVVSVTAGVIWFRFREDNDTIVYPVDLLTGTPLSSWIADIDLEAYAGPVSVAVNIRNAWMFRDNGPQWFPEVITNLQNPDLMVLALGEGGREIVSTKTILDELSLDDETICLKDLQDGWEKPLPLSSRR